MRTSLIDNVLLLIRLWETSASPVASKRTACLSKLPQWRNNHSDVFAWRADDNTHKNSAQCLPPTASDVWIAVRIFVYTLLTERSC